MKVLVADDDPVSRRLLQNYLQKWGYDVVVTTNGAEAWRMIEQEEFQMVISDWMMPELDGLDLIRRIRQHPPDHYVYTILLTSRSQKDDFVAGMDAGADDFVSKPFDQDELHVRLRAGERIVNLELALKKKYQAMHDALPAPSSIDEAPAG
ncbi:MAG: response regulator [Planctomycetaceae bacterium]